MCADILTAACAEWDCAYLEDMTARRIVLELYDGEYQSLLRYAVFLGLRKDVAQDVVQDCFLKLHGHLLNEGDRSNLRAWLYRVAHNTVRSRQSGWQESRVIGLPESSAIQLAAAGSISPEEAVLQKEKRIRFHRAVQSLSPAQRQCLMLRSQGLKYREIAEVLQLAISTVAENVTRGLEQLRCSL